MRQFNQVFVSPGTTAARLGVLYNNLLKQGFWVVSEVAPKIGSENSIRLLFRHFGLALYPYKIDGFNFRKLPDCVKMGGSSNFQCAITSVSQKMIIIWPISFDGLHLTIFGINLHYNQTSRLWPRSTPRRLSNLLHLGPVAVP